MKKLMIFFIISSFLLFSTNSYAERMYISRLSDVDLHINQSGTGPYSSDNCGPTSLAMILDYLTYPYESISWLRYKIRNFGGWVYTNEIEDYLSISDIPYRLTSIEAEEELIQILCNGGIVLVCLNISYISIDSSSTVGRSYSGGTGHYLVVSGFYKDDMNCYFEVLDPSNSTVKYYKSSEIIASICNWWPYGLVFDKYN